MNQAHQNVLALKDEDISTLLWKNFWPAFAGVIISSLYNIVDRIFIGQGVGSLALSGLSAVFPIMLIFMGFGMLFGIGAGVRVSINMGKGDFDRAERVLGNAILLVIICGICLTIIGFLVKESLLNIFGVGKEVYTYANDYLDIVLIGSLFGMIGFALNNVIRSEGNFRVAMLSMFISAGINILLDPIFIFIFDMGVKGAALATIISQFILMIWVLKHFAGKSAVIKLKLSKLKFERKIILYILSIGFAPFSMQVAASMVQGTFNKQLTIYGGDIAIASMGIINSISMLIFMSIIAINMASQPIIGFNYGADNFKRVKDTFVICLRVGTLISLGGFLIVELFPGFIVKLFESKDQDLLEITTQGMRIFMSAWILIGFQIVANSYYQAIGMAKTAAFLSLLRQVIILIPAVIILPRFFELKGVWMAGPVADISSAIIFAVFVIIELRKLNARCI